MTETIMNSFGSRLGNVIHRKGMKQCKFAEACEISQPALSNFVNDKHKPGFDTLMKIVQQAGKEELAYLLDVK